MNKFLYALVILGTLLIVASVPCCVTDMVRNPCPRGSGQILNDPIGEVGQILFWIGVFWALLGAWLSDKP